MTESNQEISQEISQNTQKDQVSLNVKTSKLLELLQKAKAAKEANQKGLTKLEKVIHQNKPDEVSFVKVLDLSPREEDKEENEEQILDFLQEITSKDNNSEVSLSSPSPVEKAKKDSEVLQAIFSNSSNSSNSSYQNEKKKEEKDLGVAKQIILNREQEKALNLALTGADFCFIGAAGTGKTTATGKIISTLIKTEKIPLLGADTKFLSSTKPGVIICSYTRKAVNNIRRAVPAELKQHTLTLHKILEYAPNFYDIEDLSNPGKTRKTMSFEPKRNKLNPLPYGLKLAIFEESSMISTELYNAWKEATPHLPQEIFIGDIQQLPPIFGPAILGFKMALLETVELKEVYRQALQSPIIRLAHSILSGDPYKFDKTIKTRKEPHPYLGGAPKLRKYVPALEQYNESSEHGSVKFEIWQQSIDPEKASNVYIQLLMHWEKTGYYDPEKDIILCPFNIDKNKKGDPVFGCTAINKGIMSLLSRRRKSPVYEIIAGYNKHYYAEGDRVLFDKEDAIITSIVRNTAYFGKAPQTPSVDLSRDGSYITELTPEEKERHDQEEVLFLEENLDDFLLTPEYLATEDDEEGRVQVASHIIKLRFTYSEEEVELRSSNEINNLLGGHALTVHKFQGSEEKNVFFVLHKSHAVMLQRELLYTAVTRASKRLHILCESESFFNGVKSAKVKGNTLAEKIEYFKGKGKFLEMKQEMDMLELQKRIKEKKIRDQQLRDNTKPEITINFEIISKTEQEKLEEKQEEIGAPNQEKQLGSGELKTSEIAPPIDFIGALPLSENKSKNYYYQEWINAMEEDQTQTNFYQDWKDALFSGDFTFDHNKGIDFRSPREIKIDDQKEKEKEKEKKSEQKLSSFELLRQKLAAKRS